MAGSESVKLSQISEGSCHKGAVWGRSFRVPGGFSQRIGCCCWSELLAVSTWARPGWLHDSLKCDLAGLHPQQIRNECGVGGCTGNGSRGAKGACDASCGPYILCPHCGVLAWGQPAVCGCASLRFTCSGHAVCRPCLRVKGCCQVSRLPPRVPPTMMSMHVHSHHDLPGLHQSFGADVAGNSCLEILCTNALVTLMACGF